MSVVVAEGGGTLVQRAMSAVAAHIREHDLRAGDTLPGERHFADLLGVSRAVMREAFGALAALKMIDVANGRKPKVATIDESLIATSMTHGISTAQITVPDVWEVRRTIERRTAELAAEHRSDEQAARIVELAKAIARDVADLEVVTRHDVEFHKAIADASRNLLFVQIVRAFGPLMETAVPEAWKTVATRAQQRAIARKHLDVARAIAARDVAAAGASMEQHFDATVGAKLQTHEVR